VPCIPRQAIDFIIRRSIVNIQGAFATSQSKPGGDMFETRDAAEGVREMQNRLRVRYSLYYGLPSCRPGERRTIHVELTAEAAADHPGAIVRARTGYLAPP
jgi:hypothetical protein